MLEEHADTWESELIDYTTILGKKKNIEKEIFLNYNLHKKL
jgi:hypothetical protein